MGERTQSMTQAMEILECGYSTVKRLIKLKKLRDLNAGQNGSGTGKRHHVRIPLADLEAVKAEYADSGYPKPERVIHVVPDPRPESMEGRQERPIEARVAILESTAKIFLARTGGQAQALHELKKIQTLCLEEVLQLQKEVTRLRRDIVDLQAKTLVDTPTVG